MNTNLQSLITMQQTTAATSALQLVGKPITVGGNSATLSNADQHSGRLEPHHLDARQRHHHGHELVHGTNAYSGTLSLNAGTQSFTWNGQGSNGQTWPNQAFTRCPVKATGANGQAVKF